jgi:hypothetical protein
MDIMRLQLRFDQLKISLDKIELKLDQILDNQTALDQKVTNYQIKGEKFMSSASQALIDLQNAVNTVVASQTNLAAAVASLQAADAAIDAALVVLEGEVKSGGSGVSAAAVEAAVAQLNTASTALAAANTSVGSVVADINAQVVTAGTGSGITVVVSPATAALAAGAQQQFSATGDPQGYIWSLNPANGMGTIDQNGLYTAPTAQSGAVQVIATSKTDSTKAGSAQVTFATSAATAVTVSPASATVAQGAQQQFSAVVTGDATNAVVWSLTPATGAGTIDQTGLYTAPTGSDGSAQVTATSTLTPSVFGNAGVSY